MYQGSGSHLTVRGGEHCGDWFGPMICEPARSGVTAKEYYAETIAWIESGNLDLPDDMLVSIIRVYVTLQVHYCF